MKLIISGIFIHLIFMGAIFDIYFKSPIISGMQPQKSDKNPPAKRLFLIVADGLRAESLYGNNLSNLDNMKTVAPYLYLKIASLEAAWGISHTRVPTESRPGHVALTAGIYEDPSAIARGWKENPVEFDSVFNQSSHTWAWGSPDIVPMFKKSENFHGFSYSSAEEDFSGKISTSLLDEWVFDNVAEFFKRDDNEELKLARSEKVIFFLHLLGLDTAGHTHKPQSREYTENIKAVDYGVKRIEGIVNYFFNDTNSAFLFTSDHGMTNWGSHGAGSAFETETPIIAWGAGIRPNKEPIEITQADIAPLVSTLIGISIPVNSVGVLPVKALNMSEKGLAFAICTNAKQIYAQYEEKRRRTESTSIWLLYKPFPELSKQEFKNVILTIEYSLKDQDYSYVMKASESLINAAIRGLDYYQNYYQRFLLTCIAWIYLGWIVSLLIYLTEPTREHIFIPKVVVHGYLNNYIRRAEYYVILHLIFIFLIVVSWFLLYVQSLPLMYYVYCTIPIYIWWSNLEKVDEWVPRIQNIFVSSKNAYQVFGGILLYLLGVETLVLCFFYRETLSLSLIIMAFWPYSLHKVNYPMKLAWTASCLLLAIFPFLPVVGSIFNLYFIAITAVIWILANFGSLFISYFTISPSYNFFIDKKQMYMAIIQSLLLAVAVFNLYSVDESIRNKNGLSWMNQYISWYLSGISLIVAFCGSNMVVARLVNIAMALLIPFILLSVSYEPLFLLVLFINLVLWLSIEHTEYSPILRNLSMIPFNKISQRSSITTKRNQIHSQDFRRGFFILFYVVLAFFGMGNMASINSFDPLWVRNFVTVFSPFLMASLILFKTIIPYLVVSCVFRAVTTCIQAPIKKMFFIVLVFSDIMGLHFLFMVKNTGSWLEIGSSISHYVIVQTMVLFLLLLYILAIPMTNFTLSMFRDNIPLYPYKVHRR